MNLDPEKRGTEGQEAVESSGSLGSIGHDNGLGIEQEGSDEEGENG